MIEKKIIEAINLPTLSRTMYDIIEIEKKNSVTYFEDIRKIIERDPILATNILKVANSPLYGFMQKVRTISHAISLLGIQKIKNIAFSYSIFDFLKKVKYKAEFGNVFYLILKKSLLISSVSSILSKKINFLEDEEMLLSGLITEIGQVVLFLYAPQKYTLIYSVIDKDLIKSEQEKFSTDHVKIGLELLKTWNLPELFGIGIKNHYEMFTRDEHSKVVYVSNKISELLLIDDNEKRKQMFLNLHKEVGELLNISLSEIEETINSLPEVLDNFVGNFPEVQRDLQKIIETSSSMIISLMKKELDMVILTKELSEAQARLLKEKNLVYHMLNLSYFFSSLLAPLKIILSLFDYFDKYLSDLRIEFIYKDPQNIQYFHYKNNKSNDPDTIMIEDFNNLLKARITNEPVNISKNEKRKLEYSDELDVFAFPISFHHNNFGFLILLSNKNKKITDVETSYINILSRIIANSFQNYYSFEKLRIETNKKELVTKELINIDEELRVARSTMLELQRSELIKQILPMIFHKLKNKLTPIIGYSQILKKSVDDEKSLTRVEKIEKNAEELTNMLNILRDYFKKDNVVKEITNINKTIEILKPYFVEIYEKYKINIKLDIDYSIEDDYLNPIEIQTLLVNLVENSVEAIKEKNISNGEILIKTKNLENDEYMLLIKDNGVGMTEEEKTLIWTPFYSNFKGRIGLGLPICEKVLINHKAKYGVNSKKGEYTEILISFNITDKVRKRAEPSLFERFELKVKKNKVSILIVDDEEYLVELMKEILLNEGDFNIRTTTSGRDALNLISKECFDLVISDIRMPDIDGMDLYDYMKRKGVHDKIIFVTADPYSEDIVRFLRDNELDFLKKPFKLTEFRREVLKKLQ